VHVVSGSLAGLDLKISGISCTPAITVNAVTVHPRCCSRPQRATGDQVNQVASTLFFHMHCLGQTTHHVTLDAISHLVAAVFLSNLDLVVNRPPV